VLTGRYVSGPIRLPLTAKRPDFDRADIEIYGVDQSGPSFEGRVFVNNPNATAETPPTPENGYAGSFHVYGYGIWPDDIGKDSATQDKDKIRAPIEKTVIATDAIRKAAAYSPEVIVTVVPIYRERPPRDGLEPLKFEGVRIIVH
jgi:hypothetical protein